MDNIRRQYAKNASGLETMRVKAEQTGRNVNGYTLEQLTQLVSDYRRYAQMTDTELRAHLSAALGKARRAS